MWTLNGQSDVRGGALAKQRQSQVRFALQIGKRVNRHAVRLDDHVTRFDPGFIRGTSRGDFANQHPFISRRAEVSAELPGEIFRLDSQAGGIHVENAESWKS